MIDAESIIQKYVVFGVAGYHCALPIEQVIRVVLYPPEINSDLQGLGLIQIGRHLIHVTDLHRWLTPDSLPSPPETPAFLLIVLNADGELRGIPADTPPDLIELSVDMLRPIPPSRGQSPLLEISSHIGIVSQGNSMRTIFILMPIRQHQQLAGGHSMGSEKASPA